MVNKKITNENLAGKIDKLLIEQISMKEKLKNVKEDITEELGQKIDNVFTAVDGITKKHEVFETELVVNKEAHGRIQGDVNEVREHLELEIKHPTLKSESA